MEIIVHYPEDNQNLKHIYVMLEELEKEQSR